MTHTLHEIEEACDCALVDAACDKKQFSGDAINWGDLHCFDVERYEDLQGDQGYRVFIEECSPDSSHLRAYIREWFCEHKLPVPQITCEW